MATIPKDGERESGGYNLLSLYLNYAPCLLIHSLTRRLVAPWLPVKKQRQRSTSALFFCFGPYWKRNLVGVDEKKGGIQWVGRMLIAHPTPCREGTIHLQTSMSSPGFEPRPYGTAVSVTNHYTGWVIFNAVKNIITEEYV
ncbi:hypothetical protein TNCV_2504941 [Trichonephila clavipes]|uniref:Uncharacterized protein n=1 Tax=Trichonephila clavipes TaxID=2585209 RepID=A0A8X6WHE2_TRICX|nr:hypothetical protein TNCV_2504941 [Trichonephila clavipes]